jgi:glycosyltransferase involved in cell wall biosynthesis
MATLRLLQLGTYPIKSPLHGGQRRVDAIRTGLLRAGLSTKYVAIYCSNSFPLEKCFASDIAVGGEIEREIGDNPVLEDLLIGELGLKDRELIRSLSALIEEFRPDIVQLEHPFLWPLVEAALKSNSAFSGIKIVYSSHNIEWELKASIYEKYFRHQAVAELVDRVRYIEADLVRRADLTVCVSDYDAAVYERELGVKCSVVRNGCSFIEADPSLSREWFTRLGRWKTKRGFFIGSDHLPNYEGFYEMVGRSLGFLAPNEEVIVAGGVCNKISSGEYSRFFPGVNFSRLRLLPQVTDEDVRALISISNAVLLPITSGGGSNLKTAEALMSGRPVIATRFAMRSYEEFSSASLLEVVDSSEEFRRALVKAFRAEGSAESFQDSVVPIRKALNWETLADQFAGLISGLAR